MTVRRLIARLLELLAPEPRPQPIPVRSDERRGRR
jgi:hypothetical protein